MSVHRNKRILILVETSRVFGQEIIQGITRFAFETGDWSLFLEDRGLVQNLGFQDRRFEYDGMIIRTTHLRQYKAVHKRKIPVVELLGPGGGRISEILTDATAIGKMAAEHFRGKGFRHFAFFSVGRSWWSEEFFDQYRSALADMGFSCGTSTFSKRETDASLPVALDNHDVDRIISWMTTLEKPVGIFCPSDSHALFLISLCHLSGIAVPQEVAILGVENNATLCNAASPPLSSIAANGQEVGYLAADLLFKKMSGISLPDLPIRVPPIQVVMRQSTDLIAISDPDIAHAVQFIRDFSSLGITVNHVADHVGLSVRTLIRHFNNAIGHPPEVEIRKARMDRAKKLLQETDMSVFAIAQAIGYGTSEYFIRAFRRECGMTPKKFRDFISTE